MLAKLLAGMKDEGVVEPGDRMIPVRSEPSPGGGSRSSSPGLPGDSAHAARGAAGWSTGKEADAVGGGREDGASEYAMSSSMWRSIPFLPALVDAIVGTPPDESPSPGRAASDSRGGSAASSPRGAGGGGSGEEEVVLGSLASPRALTAPPHAAAPSLSEPSALLEEGLVAALASVLPARYRASDWRLAYSSLRDGISLRTLLRRGAGLSPTVLVVRDARRAVFGAYCSEPWRVAPRFAGTGETFVFRAAPGPAQYWPWWWQKNAQERNDYFMRATPDGIAVGGRGGYAIWLDAELARGLSRPCLTFGTPPLAAEEEFDIGSVELWHVA